MYKTGGSCPVCVKGKLSAKVITEEFEYKGDKFLIPDYKIYSCEKCREEFVSPKTIRATEKRLTDFRRKVDGLLTSDEIKSIRKKLGRTQEEMSKWFEVGVKNFARYENGQVTQSKPMDLLLRILDDNPHILDEIREDVGYTTIGILAAACCEELEHDLKYAMKDAKYSDITEGALAA